MKHYQPGCPKCRKAKFEIRFVKEEAIASAKCVECGSNYLLLDSGDHWFDIIQKGYPRVSRCACKNTTFAIQLKYSYRDDGEIDYIEVWTTCTSCKKTKLQMGVEIDYGDTNHLFDEPLVFCNNPKVLYDLKDLSLYVSERDFVGIIDHLALVENCLFLCWVWRDDTWVLKDLPTKTVRGFVEHQRVSGQATCPYFCIYALPVSINVAKTELDLKAEDCFWKRHELVRISSVHYVVGTGHSSHPIPGHVNTLFFSINFSTEYVDGDKPVGKSRAFAELCSRLLKWMEEEFVAWRGPQCFDNPEEHVRVFGDRFKAKSGHGR